MMEPGIPHTIWFLQGILLTCRWGLTQHSSLSCAASILFLPKLCSKSLFTGLSLGVSTAEAIQDFTTAPSLSFWGEQFSFCPNYRIINQRFGLCVFCAKSQENLPCYILLFKSHISGTAFCCLAYYII